MKATSKLLHHVFESLLESTELRERFIDIEDQELRRAMLTDLEEERKGILIGHGRLSLLKDELDRTLRIGDRLSAQGINLASGSSWQSPWRFLRWSWWTGAGGGGDEDTKHVQRMYRTIIEQESILVRRLETLLQRKDATLGGGIGEAGGGAFGASAASRVPPSANDDSSSSVSVSNSPSSSFSSSCPPSHVTSLSSPFCPLAPIMFGDVVSIGKNGSLHPPISLTPPHTFSSPARPFRAYTTNPNIACGKPTHTHTHT